MHRVSWRHRILLPLLAAAALTWAEPQPIQPQNRAPIAPQPAQPGAQNPAAPGYVPARPAPPQPVPQTAPPRPLPPGRMPPPAHRPAPYHRFDGHGDMQRFHTEDFPRWRAGRWYHGLHGNRLGWWWVIGDAWYLYPEPAYPYPDPYTPPFPDRPPAPGAEGDEPQYWYFCESAQGYYPYVDACPEGWQLVPAQPPP